jgi:hypothetical protein
VPTMLGCLTLALVTCLAAGPLFAQRADTIVRTLGKPVNAGVATLHREITIGAADGSEHYMLGAIADVAVSRSGDTYVWDRSIPAIRKYDASGEYVRTIGRVGSGPGEYRAGGAIAVGPDGKLLMWDPGNARINVYAASGDAVTSWPTRSGGPGSVDGSGLLTVDTAGNVYVQSVFMLQQPGRPVDSRSGWIRFTPNGTLRDTVLKPAYPVDHVMSVEVRGQFASRVVPFTANPTIELSPLGYFVHGVSDRIAFDLLEPGKPVVSIRRSISPEPVSARERDSARADVTGSMRKVSPSWSWTGAEIPRTKPVYRALTIASDGRLWVQLAEGPPVKRDSAGLGRGQMMVMQGPGGGRSLPWSCPSNGWLLFDVYDPGGIYVGQVRTPEGVNPIVMRGDFVWGVTCSNDDVPSVGRYRIGWRATGDSRSTPSRLQPDSPAS